MNDMNGILTISIPNTNDQKTRDTIGSFAQSLESAGARDMLLGIVTEKLVPDKIAILPLIEGHRNWKGVYAWDHTATELLRAHWPTRELPFPLYDAFSYGGALNRMIILKKMAGASLMFRVDPGCSAPENLSECLVQHANSIRQGHQIVSGTYDARPAARVDFVPKPLRAAYLDLLEKRTDIPVKRQITGGALQTMGKGVPAIQFAGQRAWGTDDGLFQTLRGEWSVRCKVVDTVVCRNESGYPVPLTQYLVRVAAGVVVAQLLKGAGLATAIGEGHGFLEAARAFIDPHKLAAYDLAAAKSLLAEWAPGIEAGFAQYGLLRKNWPAILAQVCKTPGLAEHCRVR